MDLAKLKEALRDKNISFDSLIFVSKEDFLPVQYIKAISTVTNRSLQYVDELITSGFTFVDTSDIINIYRCKEIKDQELTDLHNTIIITQKISQANIPQNIDIVEFPDIQSWQIEDYIKTKCSGLSQAAVDYLQANITNIYRLDSELDKIALFLPRNQEQIFKDLVKDGNYSDLSSYNSFSISNALITHNVEELLSILKTEASIDMNPMGMLTLLYKNFKNIIDIQLGINPTAESLGLNPKQFIALKYRINKYPKSKLIEIFKILSDIDYQLKSGRLPADMIFDYCILNILKG